MTDYAAWARYGADVDGELAKTSERLRVDELVEANKHESDVAVQEVVEAQRKAQRIADALKSKEAVEALRAAGRAKRGGAAPPATASALPLPPPPPPLLLQLANAIQAVSTSLVKLAGEAEVLSRMSGAAGVGAGMQALHSVEAFRRDEFLPALALNAQAAELELLPQARGGSILDKVAGSLHGLLKHVSFHLALCAVAAGEHALAADVARYRLKLEPPASLSSNAALAPVWMVRALAFAGMGCAYLANTHCRQVQQCAASYPHIEALLARLDACEDGRAGLAANLSAALSRELRRRVLEALLAVGSGSGIGASNVPSIFDVRPETLDSLLPPLLPSEDAQEDAASDSIGDSSTPLSLLLGRLWQDETSRVSGLVLLRCLFYEGQSLFLESMFLSAEGKYCLAILVGHSCLEAEGPKGSTDDEYYSPRTVATDFGTERHQNMLSEADLAVSVYLRTLLSACYLNAATCRLQRGKAEDGGSAGPASESVSPQSVQEVIELSCAALGAKGLALCDCLQGRLRFSCILEAMRSYTAALALIDACLADDGGAVPMGPFAAAGPGPCFSQLFMLQGPVCCRMPFCALAEDEPHSVRQALLQRRERIVYLESRYGERGNVNGK